MENLIINQVPLILPEGPVNLHYCFSDDDSHRDRYHTKKIENLLLKTNLYGALRQLLLDNRTSVYFNFCFTENKPDNEWQTLSLDLEQEKYLKPIFLIDTLKEYFLRKENILIEEDFVGNISIWEKTTSDDYTQHYKVFNLRFDRPKAGNYLTIGIISQKSLIIKKNVSELGIDVGLVNKVVINKFIYKAKRIDPSRITTSVPVLNSTLVKAIPNIPALAKPNFTYNNHYNLIQEFYEKHLSGKDIGKGVKVLLSGLRKLNENEVYHIARNNNLLEFKNGNNEFDAYRGFTNYGPYKLPDFAKDIKFIFIFHESDKQLANNLYKYFLYGHRHFPGLESFTGMKFSLDKNNSVLFRDKTNPLPEIKAKLDADSFNRDTFYIGLYISPYSEESATDEERKIYFNVKEELLLHNITSQVIEAEKLKSQNVHFYLPNLAIALVAKSKGIPWKLKREVERFLLLGFGEHIVKSEEEVDHYVGNTVCFNNEGEFKDLQSFQFTEANFKEHIENAIKQHIEDNGTPSKLIIHYYKEWGTKENRDLTSVLSKLDLEVPYIVLNINDTYARDYICFDMNYPGKIPLSGTIIQLKEQKEYLLFNNERYSDDMSSYKGKDVFPIKIKIVAGKNMNLSDQQEVKALIDQIYQFSRLYWRSIKQKSVPVTTYYAKRLAEMVSAFRSKQLPSTDIATKSLWFI